MIPAAKHAIKHWSHVFPIAHVPRNQKEHDMLINLVESLMEVSRQNQDERVISLIRLISSNIEKYEEKLYRTENLSPVEILAFLMDEHGLTQNDLPEIGSQSLVSKILNGERHLTVEHIAALSKRFGASPAIFF